MPEQLDVVRGELRIVDPTARVRRVGPDGVVGCETDEEAPRTKKKGHVGAWPPGVDWCPGEHHGAQSGTRRNG